MEDLSFIYKSFILVFAGILLLRVSGRKSISQMTLAQTVIMISIGSVIIQPIIEDSVLKTIIVTGIFIISLILLEWLQLKFNFIEQFVTGKSKIIVENGQIQIKELKKLRLTVDQLEMFIRQQGITKISDIKTATLEPNGQLGYELKEEARPLTIGEFKKLVHPSLLKQSQTPSDSQVKKQTNKQLFTELNKKNQNQPPDYLQ